MAEYSLIIKPFTTLAEQAQRENYLTQLRLAIIAVFDSPTLVDNMGGYWNGPNKDKYLFGYFEKDNKAQYTAIVNKYDQVSDILFADDNMGSFTKELEEKICDELYKNIQSTTVKTVSSSAMKV
jgi:hypothetical protein